MKTRQAGRGQARRAFTLIELLTVIAIIAVLAAILFPIFGSVREQARQSNTMSNLHAVYLGARLFYEDEGRFPAALFGYAEVQDNTLSPPYRPALPSDPAGSITPMDQVTGRFITNAGQTNQSVNRGYLFREQVKDLPTFFNADSLDKDRRAITEVYWPINSPISLARGGTLQKPIPVTWTNTDTSGTCTVYGDRDLPSSLYVGRNKLYYRMDSMDIGPMLDDEGNPVKKANGDNVFELHYTPDWTHLLGASCDFDSSTKKPFVTQLKYRNPPTDRTLLTYVTHHAAVAGSSNVIVLLLSGTAKKINAKSAYTQLPLLLNSQ